AAGEGEPAGEGGGEAGRSGEGGAEGRRAQRRRRGQGRHEAPPPGGDRFTGSPPRSHRQDTAAPASTAAPRRPSPPADAGGARGQGPEAAGGGARDQGQLRRDRPRGRRVAGAVRRRGDQGFDAGG